MNKGELPRLTPCAYFLGVKGQTIANILGMGAYIPIAKQSEIDGIKQATGAKMRRQCLKIKRENR